MRRPLRQGAARAGRQGRDDRRRRRRPGVGGRAGRARAPSPTRARSARRWSGSTCTATSPSRSSPRSRAAPRPAGGARARAGDGDGAARSTRTSATGSTTTSRTRSTTAPSCARRQACPTGPGCFYPPTVLVGAARRRAGDRAGDVRAGGRRARGRSFATASRRPTGASTGSPPSCSRRSQRTRSARGASSTVGTVKINAVFGGAPGGAAEPRRGSGLGFGYGPELLDEVTHDQGRPPRGRAAGRVRPDPRVS